MTNDPWFDDGHYEISFLQNHSSAIICWHDLIAISDYILPIYIYHFIWWKWSTLIYGLTKWCLGDRVNTDTYW